MSFVREDLPAPAVDGVVDGTLDPDKVPETGTMANITNVPTQWGGSTLTLYLEDTLGAVLYLTTWPVGPHGRDIRLPLPKATLVANLGKDVRVRYTVSDVGSSRSLGFKLEQGFAGTVEFDLSPQNYLVLYTHSEARPPENIPDFARIQRVMPGATRYSSGDEKLAKVDEYGIVTVLGNGQVTIHAEGSPSGPGSYELVIKGIKEFHVLSPAADWDGARKLCDETALLLPTSGDFNRLLTFYPPPVRDDLPDVPVWGDVLGAGTAFTLDLYSGVIGAEDMATLLQVAGIKP